MGFSSGADICKRDGILAGASDLSHTVGPKYSNLRRSWSEYCHREESSQQCSKKVVVKHEN